MRRVSHKVIYIVLQFSGNSPARVCFFLGFLPILSEELEQVKFLNIVKMGKIQYIYYSTLECDMPYFG